MFHFVANLKDYTFHRGRGIRRFDSYLLSVDFAGGRQPLARKAVNNGHTLCADNGNFDRIRSLIGEYKAAAEAIHEDRKNEEHDLDGYARPGQLSTAVRDRYRAFATTVASEQRDSTPDDMLKMVVQSQLVLKPRYLVGMENLVLPVLSANDVEPEYAQLPSSFYEPIVAQALDYCLRTQRGEFGQCDPAVFAGLHAQDLDTAVLAGRLAGIAGVEGIATGLGGALSDRNYVDFRIEDGKLIDTPRAIPRSYLRVAEIATGMHRGFAVETNRRLRFHSLGVGTPILLVMIAALGDAETFLSSDSTAPIVDAWFSPTISLYVDEPATLKLKAHRIAEYWITKNLAWRCECPYCRRFNERHPPDLDGARKLWRDMGQPKLRKFHMHGKHDFSKHLPLLGFHEDRDLNEEAALARVGHNHWIVNRIERAAREASATPASLIDWAQQKIDAYQDSFAGTAWKAAIAVSWQFIRQTALDLQDIQPAPPGWNRD